MNLDELVNNVISIGGDSNFVQNPHCSSSSSSSSPPNVLGNDNLNGTLMSEKTVEEVWKEIVYQGINVNAANDPSFQRHQLTLGENEDIVISPGRPLMAIDPMVMVDSNFKVSDQLGCSDNQLGYPALPVQAVVATSNADRCRLKGEMMEKSIDRRQRRMIKNRESAARSRARKQVQSWN